ncbi:MAG: hypothetical protein RL385_3 [Pseudomonadota bacterium]|jgi:soluble lytic murein transglycosylase-like protein
MKWFGKAIAVALSLSPAASRGQSYQQVMRERGCTVPGIIHLVEDKRWRTVAFPGRHGARGGGRAHKVFDRTAYDAHFADAAKAYELPVALLHAVAHTESAFNPEAVSGDGAMGLMQLMPFTAKKMGVSDAFDPRQNILGGARYLRILANRWKGDLVRTIASYNAGPGAVERYQGIPPYAETQRYVQRVLARFRQYAGRSST